MNPVHKTNLLAVIRTFLSGFALPPRISTAEWADSYYVVPDTANMPGPWRTDHTPHVRAWFDAFDDPNVEELTIKGSAQIAKTSFILIITGKTIHINPQPILILQPTDEVARQFSETKLEDMISDCKVIRQRVDFGKSRTKKKKLFKRYPGGFLKIVGGFSPHGLRQMSIPIVLSDDIDSIEMNLAKEGDPVLRAEKRSKTFDGSRKKIRCSTPSRKNASRIDAFYREGTQERYHIPCPKCGEYQYPDRFELVIWDKDTDMFGNASNHYPETARLTCMHCGYEMSESERKQACKNGKWIAKNPAVKHHRSFQINELVSTLSSLESVVKDYLISSVTEEGYETFVNTCLGEVYEPKAAIEYDPLNLIGRCEEYLTPENPHLPDGVMLLTCAVDVQNDRLEAAVYGWGEGEENWIIGTWKFYGDIDSEEVFQNIDRLRKHKWTRADGVQLGVSTTLIDSGFQGKHKMVYDYCWKRRRERNVFASKGYGNPGRELFTWSKRFNSSLDLILIGTNEAKSNLYQVRLPISEPGPKYIHFAEGVCDYSYFEQLTSEVGIRKKSGMVEYMVYNKRNQGDRNEQLDLWVMNYVAMCLRPVNWVALKKKIAAEAEKIKAPAQIINEIKERKIETVAEAVEAVKEIVQEIKKEPARPKPRPVVKRTSSGGWMDGW